LRALGAKAMIETRTQLSTCTSRCNQAQRLFSLCRRNTTAPYVLDDWLVWDRAKEHTVMMGNW